MKTEYAWPDKFRKMAGNYLFAAFFSVMAAFVINFAIELSGLTELSDKYRQVSESQYSVSILTGVFLYGVVAPVLEESIFRLGIYNLLYKTIDFLMKKVMRMIRPEQSDEEITKKEITKKEITKKEIINKEIKKKKNITAVFWSVLISAVLFGAYHGNIVQFVYAGCMGILLASFYAVSGRISIPIVMHSAANIAVFLFAMLI